MEEKAKLNREIERRLSRALAERDQAEAMLIEARRALAEQESRLSVCAEQLVQAETALAGTLASRSWKFTAPLRASSRFAREARRLLRAVGRSPGTRARQGRRALSFARQAEVTLSARIPRHDAPGEPASRLVVGAAHDAEDGASGRSGSMSPIHLDEPREPTFRTPVDYLWGWIEVTDSSGEFDVRVHGERPQFARIHRPELPDESHIGFLVFVDLIELASRGRVPAGKCSVDFYLDDRHIASLPLVVEPSATQRIDELVEERRAKREFVLANCDRPLHIPDGCRALSSLPPDWRINPAMSAKTDAISAHGYGADVEAFLDQLPEGAMVLDAGAGLRREPFKNVISMEIYDYPTTDILAIGQALPFRDSVFDAIISIAVLEHVDDPFLCSRELIRVLKPGGKIYCCIPFLQAEHGYPSHFFNCTRFGIRRLFQGLDLDRHYLEMANHPIFTIHQILGVYASGLRADLRERFLQMNVGEIVREAPVDRYIRGEAIVTDLDEEERWKIAWGTTAIFSKPWAA